MQLTVVLLAFAMQNATAPAVQPPPIQTTPAAGSAPTTLQAKWPRRDGEAGEDIAGVGRGRGLVERDPDAGRGDGPEVDAAGAGGL